MEHARDRGHEVDPALARARGVEPRAARRRRRAGARPRPRGARPAPGRAPWPRRLRAARRRRPRGRPPSGGGPWARRRPADREVAREDGPGEPGRRRATRRRSARAAPARSGPAPSAGAAERRLDRPPGVHDGHRRAVLALGVDVAVDRRRRPSRAPRPPRSRRGPVAPDERPLHGRRRGTASSPTPVTPTRACSIAPPLRATTTPRRPTSAYPEAGCSSFAYAPPAPAGQRPRRTATRSSSSRDRRLRTAR